MLIEWPEEGELDRSMNSIEEEEFPEVKDIVSID
jgi:hypothetical protein